VAILQYYAVLAMFAAALHESWRYRHLLWECGMVGQALYLEADAAGVLSTGIGCFFDDEMHTLLGIYNYSWQSPYHFTVGGALRIRQRVLFSYTEVRVSLLAPQGLPHGLGKRREHDIEADANSQELALVGIHRVRQPSRKND